MTPGQHIAEVSETTDALDEDEGSARGVWLTIGMFVVFIVGVSGCFAFQVF